MNQILLSTPGWCTPEKQQELHNLVLKTYNEFEGIEIKSVELGVFGGKSLFPIALAHKELNAGKALGIDTWDNEAPLEGTNSPENNHWWANLDIAGIETTCRKNLIALELQKHCLLKKARTTDEAFTKIADDSVTLIHQDSAHNREVIIKELLFWAPKLKVGGYWVADDTDWVEAQEGYSTLSLFGFELVEDYGKWAVYQKKTSPIVSRELVDDFLGKKKITIKIESATENYSITIPESSLEVSFEQPTSNQTAIQPILLYLPDTQEWLDRWEAGKQHFEEAGLTTSTLFSKLIHVPGVHAAKFGIIGTHVYMRDAYSRLRHSYNGKELPARMPSELKEQFKNIDGKIGGNLSHYILYNVMNVLPNKYFMVLEDDCRLSEGWQDKLQQALKDVPADFDFLFVGSCCATDKDPIHVKNDIYHFPHREDKPDFYPQSGHCYIVAKKAIPILLATQRDTADPVDVQLIYEAFPHLNVYAILPRLAEQGKDTLLPS